MIDKNIHISCEVCQDLMPLVLDEIASEDSCILVQQHIDKCDACNKLYSGTEKSFAKGINDQKNILKIRRKLSLFGLGLLCMGAILGVYLSDTSNIFYNIIIMPIVGTLNYIINRKKWYVIPCGIAMLTYLWLFWANVIESKEISNESFMYPIFFVLIYTGLTMLGTAIGALLRFAYQREEIQNEK